MKDTIKKIIVKYGGAISIEAGTPTTNSYGEESFSYGTASSSYAVPFDYFSELGSWSDMGRLIEGESLMVTPYDTTVSTDDRVTLFSQTYTVSSVENFAFKGVVVGKQITLKKRNI